MIGSFWNLCRATCPAMPVDKVKQHIFDLDKFISSSNFRNVLSSNINYNKKHSGHICLVVQAL